MKKKSESETNSLREQENHVYVPETIRKARRIGSEVLIALPDSYAKPGDLFEIKQKGNDIELLKLKVDYTRDL